MISKHKIMKTILVLTDFSENAAHAAKSSVMLGEKLHADILLVNNIAGIPVTPYYIGGGFVAEEASWMIDECNKNLKKLTEVLEPIIARIDPQNHRPTVHKQIAEGNIGENIVNAIHHMDIELIVMGAKTGSTMDHILSGSETNSVINHATSPILVIPAGVDFKKLKKVVFATDFKKADFDAVDYLVKLGEVFNFQLQIVHVSLIGKSETDREEQQRDFMAKITGLNYPKITYMDVRGKDVIERLNRLCDETEADMLTLVHYPHSFFTLILKDSYTQKALRDQNIPLLIFPAK